MNAGKTENEKDNGQQEKKNHLEWLRHFAEFLWADTKQEIRKARFWVEVGALMGLAFYVCETRRTNNLTQHAIEDARTNFRIGERPYLFPDGTKTDPPLSQVAETQCEGVRALPLALEPLYEIQWVTSE
jgi:hypothetical protein